MPTGGRSVTYRKAAAMRSLNGCMIVPVFKIKKQSQLRRAA